MGGNEGVRGPESLVQTWPGKSVGSASSYGGWHVDRLTAHVRSYPTAGGKQVKGTQKWVTEGGKCSAQDGKLPPGSLSYRELPHKVLLPSRFVPVSLEQTDSPVPGHQAGLPGLDFWTESHPMWHPWGRGGTWGREGLDSCLQFALPSLSQAKGVGPQAECLLARVCLSFKYKWTQVSPLLPFPLGSAISLSKRTLTLKYFCSPQHKFMSYNRNLWVSPNV